MKTLLWKDCHVNRIVLGAAGVALVLPYFMGAVIKNLFSWLHYGSYVPWPVVLTYAGLYSLIFLVLLVGVLGGNAVAGERADRSAEFLAYLPVSRRAIITSKAVVGVSVGVLVWLINVIVIHGLVPHVGAASAFEVADISHIRNEVVPIVAMTAVLVFGMSWLCSAFLRSPAISAVAGLAAPIVLVIVMATVQETLGDATEFPRTWWLRLCLILGIVSFSGGVWYYLRRVEP